MRAHILALALGFVLLAGAAPAQAGFDIDFGANVQVGDDTDLYFAISSRYFDRDRAEVKHWGARYDDPDHLAVALFISRHSGESLESIYRMRRQGYYWWDISARVGMPMDVWFVPVKHQPGPPYGNAYGHWKKHRGNPQMTRLSDSDMCNLVAVRMLHDYYAVPVEVAMDMRSSGRHLHVLMSDEYGKRHGKGHGKSASPGKSKHRGKGHGKGKSKGR